MSVITYLYRLLLRFLRYERIKPPTLHDQTPSHLATHSPAKPTFAAQQLADATAERDQLIYWVKDMREEYKLWHNAIHELDRDLRQYNSITMHGWTQAQISEWELELADLAEDREYCANGLGLVRNEWTKLMKDLSKQWPLVSCRY